MEITSQKIGRTLVARLNGRLDTSWCAHVQDALSGFVRAGEHDITLDMSEVGYVSSSGLRVLLTTYKQLKSIKGRFAVAPASDTVRSVLELAGLDMLLGSAVTAPREATTAPFAFSTAAAAPRRASNTFNTAAARWDIIDLPAAKPLVFRAITQPAFTAFPAATFGLGIGALGNPGDDTSGRQGEFLAAAGCAAYQPTDGSARPDFIVTQGALIPQTHLLSGLVGEGAFPLLLRFAVQGEARGVGLAEIAQAALDAADAPAVAFVAVTETSGLVGATLRRPPATSPADRFAFPQIRDTLSFTAERAFRDSTSLLVGVVVHPGANVPWADQLRPLAAGDRPLLGHVHAAAFPYRPIPKGNIDYAATVTSLFDGPSLQSVLHLLADTRGIHGAGESEFYRGALWLAPIS